ncbi:MAG: hydroxyisourate hydrolase [Rhodothermia bacterium]
MSISTHVLDTSAGCPADGVTVYLESLTNVEDGRLIGSGTTDIDGRVGDLVQDPTPITAGTYRLTFETGDYFERAGVSSFHPRVQILFSVRDVDEHYHVPLLLSPFGYTTYRGS